MTTDTMTDDRPDTTAMKTYEGQVVTEYTTKRARFRLGTWIIRILTLIAFLLAWQGLSTFGIARVEFVSTPLGVIGSFIRIITDPGSWIHIGATISAAILAMITGSAAGVITAVIFWRFPMLRTAVNPYVTTLNALPRPALAPIFIVWFGLGLGPKVLVGASVVYFIMLLTTLAGLQNTQDDNTTLGRSLNLTRTRMLWLIEIPSAIPAIIAGLRLAAVYSVLGVIVSEIVASYHGLGQMLTRATNSFQIDDAFAILLMTALIAQLLDGLVWLIQRFSPSTNTN